MSPMSKSFNVYFLFFYQKRVDIVIQLQKIKNLHYQQHNNNNTVACPHVGLLQIHKSLKDT